MAVDPRLECLPEHEGPAFRTWKLIMQTTMGKATQPSSPSVFPLDEKFPFRAGEDFIPLSSKPDELSKLAVVAEDGKPADANDRFSNMKRKKAEVSSSDSSEDEEEKTPVAPWKKRDYPANAYGLHLEILDFYEFMSPLPEEEAMRNDVVHRMTEVIVELWPSAKVEVFGSFRTKSYLPTSDIDLVVFGKWKNLPLFTLEKALVNKDIVDPAAIKVLDKASVPIIKLTDKQSKVRVDISFNTDTAVKGAELIKNYMDEFKILPYLFRILKHFLVQRDLNEVFTGGISSYCLMLLVISFLQRHPRTDVKKDMVNLGVLLMEFFELYGRNFNYQRIGIKLTNGGRYISKDEIMKDMGNGEYPPLLCIEDPITQGIDIGKSSFGIMRVKEAFEYAFNVVDSALRNRFYFKVNPNSTYLSRIISIPKDVMDYRKWVQSTYASQLLCSPKPAFVVPSSPVFHHQPIAFNGSSRPPLLPTPPSPYSPRITLVTSPILQFGPGASPNPYGQIGFFGGVPGQPLMLPSTTASVITTNAGSNMRHIFSSSDLSNGQYPNTMPVNAPRLGQIAYVVPTVYGPPPIEQVRTMLPSMVTKLPSPYYPPVNMYGGRASSSSPKAFPDIKEKSQLDCRTYVEHDVHVTDNPSRQFSERWASIGSTAGLSADVNLNSSHGSSLKQAYADPEHASVLSPPADGERSGASSPASDDSAVSSSVICLDTTSESAVSVSTSRAQEFILLSDDEPASALDAGALDSSRAVKSVAETKEAPYSHCAEVSSSRVSRQGALPQSFQSRSMPDGRRRYGASQTWSRK